MHIYFDNKIFSVDSLKRKNETKIKANIATLSHSGLEDKALDGALAVAKEHKALANTNSTPDGLKIHSDFYEYVCSKESYDEFFKEIALFYEDFLNPSPTLIVKTSGSTGKAKEIVVKKEHMINSAKATLSFLGLKEHDSAFLCMPVNFIAGKMMLVRALVGGLNLCAQKPCRNPFALVHKSFDFVAITPMQCTCICKDDVSKGHLFKSKNIIIGGGAVDSNLLKFIQDSATDKCRVYSTYGMTETLSHIAMRDLLSDDNSYTLFDNVTLTQDDNGCAIIDAPLICDTKLYTNDIIKLLDNRHFYILGRKDNVINTGGIKVLIEDLEDKLKDSIPLPFAISKYEDKTYGEAICLVLEGDENNLPQDKVLFSCARVLDRHFVPKHVIYTKKIPLTQTDKKDRAKIYALVKELV